MSIPIVVVLFVVVVVVVLLFNSATDNSKATIFLAIVSKAFGVTHWLHDFLQAVSMETGFAKHSPLKAHKGQCLWLSTQVGCCEASSW